MLHYLSASSVENEKSEINLTLILWGHNFYSLQNFKNLTVSLVISAGEGAIVCLYVCLLGLLKGDTYTPDFTILKLVFLSIFLVS